MTDNLTYLDSSNQTRVVKHGMRQRRCKVSGWWSSHLKIIAVSVGECDLRGPLGRMMVGNDYSTVVRNIKLVDLLVLWEGVAR